MNIYKFVKSNPIILVFLIGGLHVFLMWPGILSPDSQTQYSMAIAGIYNDHHPPLMAFVWRYFNYIIPGSGMMFLLHLSLLYSAIFYLINSFNNFKFKFVFLLFSLIPQIFFYSNMIWKDVGFTFSFLFVAAYLNYVTATKQSLTWYKTIILIIILLYGSAIKFQAQFCAPILLAWLLCVLSNYQINIKNFVKLFSVLILLFYTILNSINYLLIPNVQKNHSWQNVKLYDLAAVSVAVNKNCFPNFTMYDTFSMQELNKRFNRKTLDRLSYYMVDDLIFDNPILRIGNNKLERKELYVKWVKTIFKYPYIYVKHRVINMVSMLLYHPSFKYIDKIFKNYSTVYFLANFIAYVIMSNLIPAILCFMYFILGIFALRVTIWPAVSLMFFNAVGLAMLLVLFFCSMAGTPRYTYIMVCMVHASHVFAYLCFKNLRTLKKCSN